MLHSNGDLAPHSFVAGRYAAYRDEPVLPPRWITGADLLALGVPSGPALGALLQAAYDRQLEAADPDREALLAWVRGQVESTLR
jgi:hypothetical protein